jgi:hypothetical protein
MEPRNNGLALANGRPRAGSAGKGALARRSAAPGSDDARRLIATLLREFFQTENSARWHPTREAERLGDVVPARAMAAIARHATAALEQLPAVAAARGLPTSAGGLTAGRLFSAVRDKALDLFLTTEKSYRGTLLGLRHGVDLAKLLRETAEAAGDRDLAAFCDRWLAKRVPLLADAAGQLAWFGERPARALAPIRSGAFARLARASMRALGAAEQSLSVATEH